MTTMQEAERGRQSEHQDDNRVLSFREWAKLNNFSEATGRRIISAGIGPVVTQLSTRRIGITIGANRAWQAARARKTVAA